MFTERVGKLLTDSPGSHRTLVSRRHKVMVYISSTAVI